MASALDGIRVLNLSQSIAGGWCSRLLGDLGADVIVLEAPDGSALRHVPPFAPDGSSIPARYVLASQRSLTLDVASEAERETALRLARSVDILVEDEAAVTQLGPERAALRAENPALITVSVTANGRVGPRSDWMGNDLTAFALSGWAAVNGPPDKLPLKGPGYVGSYVSGVAAAGAAVAALIGRDGDGLGDDIDVAAADVLATMLGPVVMNAQYTNQLTARHVMWWDNPLGGLQHVADGYFSMILGRSYYWRDAMNALGLPDLADDERYENHSFIATNGPQYRDRVLAAMRERSKSELFETLSTLRIAAGPVLEIPELARDEHLAARRFFVEAKQPTEGLRYCRPAFRMSESPPLVRLEAATAGADSSAILAELDAQPRPAAGPQAANPAAGNDPPSSNGARTLPLDGIRVVALTQVWAGPGCAQLLGLLGAEVIKIEARRRPDQWRGGGGYEFRIPAAIENLPTARHGWNCHPSFNATNLNAQGITLDIQRPAGLELFRRLISRSDVVIENFTPRVLQNLGLQYEEMRKLRDDIILCSISGYGQDGPYRNRPANGGAIEPTSGVASVHGYPGGPPMNSGTMFPDPVASQYATLSVLAALAYRKRTGKGQYIDLSMQEANLSLIGDAVLEYEITGHTRERMGNRHLTFAPHGIYPAAGDDKWLALAVENEDQWSSLCIVANHPEWIEDQRFISAAARKSHENDLDAVIASWTVTRARDDVVDDLVSGGVIAAPVLAPGEVASDTTFRERGTAVEVEHPEAGAWRHLAIPWRFSRRPARVDLPAPCHGEHSFSILSGLLGVTSDEYDLLVSENITGSGPPV